MQVIALSLLTGVAALQVLPPKMNYFCKNYMNFHQNKFILIQFLIRSRCPIVAVRMMVSMMASPRTPPPIVVVLAPGKFDQIWKEDTTLIEINIFWFSTTYVVGKYCVNALIVILFVKSFIWSQCQNILQQLMRWRHIFPKYMLWKIKSDWFRSKQSYRFIFCFVQWFSRCPQRLEGFEQVRLFCPKLQKPVDVQASKMK